MPEQLDVKHGVLALMILKTLEGRGAQSTARFTVAGRKQLARETRECQQTADLIAAFLSPKREAR